MRYVLAVAFVLLSAAALGQQMVPLTEWRAQLDVDLGKIPMSREAHGQVISILQAYERQAQAEKARAKEPPK
jgi:hypothetical protein